jgi:hypothetical protein
MKMRDLQLSRHPVILDGCHPISKKQSSYGAMLEKSSILERYLRDKRNIFKNFLHLPCQYLKGNLQSNERLLIFYATELIKKTRTVMIQETGNESEDKIRIIAVEIIFIIKLQELNYIVGQKWPQYTELSPTPLAINKKKLNYCPCFESHDHYKYDHFVQNIFFNITVLNIYDRS